MAPAWPAYLNVPLAEIRRRAERAVAALERCEVCPRNCRVDRLANEARVCATGRHARVSTYFAHFGEEDCLRGTRGSGTIFFSFCNLKCVFCQNHDTSQAGQGREVSAEELAEIMLELQNRERCHNINFVTPEHVVPQILEALPLAIEAGLRLPLVYNTSSYDALESLGWMEGLVDIYMPDFKVWTKESAIRYLKAKDYPAVARAVVAEMHRQVGALELDDEGMALRGVLVRHLVMPGLLEETQAICRRGLRARAWPRPAEMNSAGPHPEFLAEQVSPDTYVNVMGQYRPEYRAAEYAEINRRPTAEEMRAALELFSASGLHRLDRRNPRRLFLFM